MKRERPYGPPAPRLSEPDLEFSLGEIGNHLRSCRQALTTQERFSFETNISKATINKSEKGCDILLSTLLKFIYGLNKTPEEFFATMDKKAR